VLVIDFVPTDVLGIQVCVIPSVIEFDAVLFESIKSANSFYDVFLLVVMPISTEIAIFD
jgi:hypothetical protein